jgi:transcription initiation factor TFIID subunit 10
LVGLAAQKFVFDVATDALEYCKHRKGAGYKKRKNGDEVYTLTMEDLTASLRDRGVNVMKPDYYVGHPNELQADQQQRQ